MVWTLEWVRFIRGAYQRKIENSSPDAVMSDRRNPSPVGLTTCELCDEELGKVLKWRCERGAFAKGVESN